MNQERLHEAVAQLRDGRLVAYPTETVWGLGADATSKAAVERLRAWKGRDPNQPISVLIAHPEVLASLGLKLSPAAQALANAFWPGPVTLVLPCPSDRFAPGVVNQAGGVGIRCSPHPVASALAQALEDAGVGPVTATSFNLCEDPAVRSHAEAEALCAASDDAPLLLDGTDAGSSQGQVRESTVVDMTCEPAKVLRVGAVDLQRLRAVVEEIEAA